MSMSDPVDAERVLRHKREQHAELRRRMAEVAGYVAATEEKIAATLDEVAKFRPPHDAERLNAKAEEARKFAAKERDRSASFEATARGDDAM
ncbi:MAG TPA: hypothetical protein VH589_04055 [Trebonia sp.]|jgi:hypothetical protein